MVVFSKKKNNKSADQILVNIKNNNRTYQTKQINNNENQKTL
jgi:hypothetical protein